jgi:hypothetical protein
LSDIHEKVSSTAALKFLGEGWVSKKAWLVKTLDMKASSKGAAASGERVLANRAR